ncbi:hypothetical protein ACVW16_001046 [Bradyrhizobium sp. USDA 4474]
MSNVVPINRYPGHPLRALKAFAEDADRLARRAVELDELPGTIRARAEVMQDREMIAKLFADAKRDATLNEADVTTLAQCEAALARFDPDSNYDGDDLRLSVVGERVAVLLGAFPNAAPGDPEVYIRTVVENVRSVEMTLPALDAAIWQIVGSLKFTPAPSEVLEIVSRQQDDWDRRAHAIFTLAARSRCTIARIEALEIEAQEAARARAEKQQAAEKARAVDQARRALDGARTRLSEMNVELTERQQAFAAAMVWMRECQDDVLKCEQALAEAMKRLNE